VAALVTGFILDRRRSSGLSLPPGLRAVPLDVAGLYFAPATEEVCEAATSADAVLAAQVTGFHELTEGVAGLGRKLSADGAVLYIDVEFFGGDGIQSVIGWEDGKVVFGPSFTRTPGQDERRFKPAQRRDMAVNAGLRAIGVHARPGADEFLTVGLARHKWNKDWLQE
jgi:hypothetical protein